MFKWFKRYREEGSTVECEHEFEKVDEKVDKPCDVCGKPYRMVYEYKCIKCGYSRLEWKTLGGGEVKMGTDIWGYSKYASLCEECYEKYEELKAQIMAYLDERSIGVEMTYVEPARLINIRIGGDWKQALDGMIKQFKFISKPEYDEECGITFYAFPENPLSEPYEVRIPPRRLVEYLKLREAGKK